MKGIIKVSDDGAEISDNLLWGLERTLAIVLRDSLRAFASKCNSYPYYFDENWNIAVDNEASSKCTYIKWINHLNAIADKFDYYLKDASKVIADKGINKESIKEMESIEEKQVKCVEEALIELSKIYASLWD